MNKVFLIGNLTKDPEASETQSGVQYCRFTIAVNRPFENADGEKETDFLNVIAWRGTADICGKYLKKGSKVAVEGSVRVRTYEKDGQKRTATEIFADRVEFIGGGPKNGAEGENKAQTAAPKAYEKPTAKQESFYEEEDDDKLPF